MSGGRKLVVVLSGMLIAGLVSACSDGSGKPLRVGINPWPGYALLFVAAEKGFFAEEGVDVQLVELTSLADVRRAFERGQVDGMASSLVEVLEVSRHTDRRARIGLVADYSNGADVILARVSHADMSSLKGQRIGIEPGTLDRFILARALEAHDMAMDEVEIVNISQTSMMEALVGGDVEAVVTYPPVSVAIARRERVHQVFSSAEIPGEIADVVSFDEGVATRRPAMIKAFSRAWGRAVAYAAEHPEDAYALMSKHVGLSIEELRTAYQGIQIVPADRQAEFLQVDGVLAKGIVTLSAILWPETAGDQELETEAFFIEQRSKGNVAHVW